MHFLLILAGGLFTLTQVLTTIENALIVFFELIFSNT